MLAYLDDPEVSIDTNHLEHALRVILLGKGNWLFSWTEMGAKHVCIVHSLLATCRLTHVRLAPRRDRLVLFQVKRRQAVAFTALNIINDVYTMNLKEHMQMPVETHGTAASAVHQVTGVFLANHCAVDKVQADYGEDLLIQPSFREQIEHFKIWVQVKGTTNIEGYRQASGEIVRYIDFAHMYKWLRSKELCVLVLWDIEKHEGLFYLPKDELSEWDFYTERKATIRVVFNESNVLSSQTLPQVIWRARYEHYAMLASYAIERERHGLSDEDKRHASSMYLSVLIDFLRQADVLIRVPLAPDEEVEDEDVRQAGYSLELCEEVRIKVLNACPALQKVDPGDDATTIAGMAVGLVLLVTLEERTGAFGVPPQLLEYCIPVLAKLMVLL